MENKQGISQNNIQKTTNIVILQKILFIKLVNYSPWISLKLKHKTLLIIIVI